MFAEVATKGLRRTITGIADHGADDVFIFVEGRPSPGNILQRAGLITGRRRRIHRPNREAKKQPKRDFILKPEVPFPDRLAACSRDRVGR